VFVYFVAARRFTAALTAFGVLAVLSLGASSLEASDRYDGYRVVRSPIVVIDMTSGSARATYTVAVRLNKDMSRSAARIFLGTAPASGIVTGNDSLAYKIGARGKHCYFTEGIGDGQVPLPKSLRADTTGKLVTVVLFTRKHALRIPARVVRFKHTSASDEAHYARALGCGKH